MKAIQYLEANKIGVCEVPIPEVPEGWGLIKVSHAGICGTDLNIYAGTHPRAKGPVTIGHEFSGVMASDTSKYKKGQKVTVFPYIPCQECEACKEGNIHVCNTLKLFGIDTDGGMAEYVAIPENQIIPIADTVSEKLGALIEPVAISVHTLRQTKFLSGNSTLVFGCGTIGLCVALTLRQFGARNMVLVETDDARVEIARGMGFTVVNPMKEDLYTIVADKTNGNGFDIVYDCAGAQAVANCLLDVVKVRGQIVVVAAYKKPAELPLFKGMIKETSIHFVRNSTFKDFEIAADLIEKETLYEKIITHVVPYEKAQEGFDLLFTKGTGAVKVMYKF